MASRSDATLLCYNVTMKSLKITNIRLNYIFLIFATLTLLLMSYFFVAYASNTQSIFKKMAQVNMPDMKTPHILEVKMPSEISGAVVYDSTDQIFIPSVTIKDEKSPRLEPVSSSASYPEAMFDDDYNSFSEFKTNGTTLQRSEVVFNVSPKAKVRAMRLVLPEHVALPNYVLIYDDSNAKVLLARSQVSSNMISFPETYTGQLAVRFEHMQPLRISEIRLVSDSVGASQRLRFLAEPGHSYKIFALPAYAPHISYPETPNLHDNSRVKTATTGAFQDNPLFVEPDSDSDGVIDMQDNCVNIANPDQKDIDKNGRGDACDDFDSDGVINIKDNCPNTPNVAQVDIDRDGKGDACDKEESRFTEKYPWLIWVGVGALFLMFLGMLTIMLKKDPGMLNMDNEPKNDNGNTEEPTQVSNE